MANWNALKGLGRILFSETAVLRIPFSICDLRSWPRMLYVGRRSKTLQINKVWRKVERSGCGRRFKRGPCFSLCATQTTFSPLLSPSIFCLVARSSRSELRGWVPGRETSPKRKGGGKHHGAAQTRRHTSVRCSCPPRTQV